MKWKQKEIAQWILNQGIGAKVTSKTVAKNIYGREDYLTKIKASMILLKVYKNWKHLAGDETLLIRFPGLGNEIAYGLHFNDEDNRYELTKGILSKAQRDAANSQGSRKTNFEVATNAGIEILPDMDTLVLQVRQVANKGTQEDKLRLVGAVSPVFSEFARLAEAQETLALGKPKKNSRNNKQLALAGSSKEHSNA